MEKLISDSDKDYEKNKWSNVIECLEEETIRRAIREGFSTKVTISSLKLRPKF